MSTYRECQNHTNNFSNRMEAKNSTTDNTYLLADNGSPQDFDFNLPCRFFKSSFARSLSLNHSSCNSGSSSNCKSLGYEICSNNNRNNKFCFKRDTIAASAVPPLPQKRLSQAGSYNEANTCAQKQVFSKESYIADQEKPPALPARCPINLHNSMLSQNASVNECQMNEEQNLQQTMMTQLKHQACKQSTNNSNNNSLMVANSNTSNKNSITNNNNSTQHSIGLQVSSQQQSSSNQKPEHHGLIVNISKNVTSSSGNNNKNTSRKNSIVWPNQQANVEQDCRDCTSAELNAGADVDELNSNYDNKNNLLDMNDYNNHFLNCHQRVYTIPTSNVRSNQQHQRHQKQKTHNQQQQQQQHRMSYEILNNNATNVEAVILQNQVDTLQWQLKQVETSCGMYRAVMEEVARFLECYQSQKQLQQQQQQELQQQMAIQKHYNSINNNNNNKKEQIPRSKSLFQVYIAGGHEKSANDSNVFDEATRTSLSCASNSASYARARSSTNLIDLKHQQSNGSCNSKPKDDHIFDTNLTPSQSYNAFKDFTWRRLPKKSDSRSNVTKDDVEEKLNQEAYRLLRTIQNFLNTSQYHPDLANQCHSLGSAIELHTGRLSTISTTSISTLYGPPAMLNSTSANTANSPTSDSLTVSPTDTTANNVATNNNLAPELLFLRAAHMRDSRLSLRSSTDSSVHSASSVASSVSSKVCVETDEEPSPKFHSPPKILSHKSHHHLVGSSTEDESGFSSINSYPEIGVPLNSTMLANTHCNSKNRLIGKEPMPSEAKETDLHQANGGSPNTTLKANVVGLPLNSSLDMSQRWDSTSKTYHNASNKFQRFSALINEDSNAVLWV